MNYDMFSGKQDEDLDPNYIYPRPYIDPMMYINPYGMNNNFYPTMPMDASMGMGNYMTYMNPYMNNPFMGNMTDEIDSDFDQDDDNENMNMHMQQQMANMMQGMMPNMQGMMMPGMQGMPQMQGMMQGMMPNMMFPYMMMPGMMFPYMMMPGMSPINMEEFDEEEM